MAGTVGAIFNGALQLGSAIGLAAVSSITDSVQEKKDGPGEGQDISDADFAGRRAAFWFLFAIVCVELVSVGFLYKTGGMGWRGEKGEVNVHLMEAGKGSGIAARRMAREGKEVDVSEMERGEKAIDEEKVETIDEEKEAVMEIEEVPSTSRRVSIIREEYTDADSSLNHLNDDVIELPYIPPVKAV